MNKAISNLVAKGINFSVADFHKFKVMDTVSNIIAKSQMDLFFVKMRMTMLTLNADKKTQAQTNQTLAPTQMIDENKKWLSPSTNHQN